MHWEKVWIVVGVDQVGHALLAGPYASSTEARKVGSEKIRYDPEWRRAFILEAPFGYDFHMSPAIPDVLQPDKVRREQFPELPPMVLGQNDYAHIHAARGGAPRPYQPEHVIKDRVKPGRKGKL